MVVINEQVSYLVGLITGKGYIDYQSITIDFPCNNEFIDGIAHCPICNHLATKPSGESILKCKNQKCVNSRSACLDLSLKKTYNQAESFKKSIEGIIVPFLAQTLKFNFNILSNSSGTSLNLKFDRELHSFFQKLFSPNVSFTNFTIPQLMWEVEEIYKIEFVNGLLDTIGFANAGGWIPRNGKSGSCRMRVYFQIINRNYKLPVAIDNYMRSCFSLPIQTIDWGHPNIRDSNLVDYFAGKKSSMGREHQVKFYPEFYGKFKFRIGSKQALFQELLNHNISCQFDSEEDWFKGKIEPILEKDIKAYHPFEDNPLIDSPVRLHVDALWQVNLRMGCIYLKKLQENAADHELFAITGISDAVSNPTNIINYFKQVSKDKYFLLENNRKHTSKVKKATIKKETLTEHDTYPILKNWLVKQISHNPSIRGSVYITSEQTISNFMQDRTGKFEEHVKKFENLDLMSIRPDLIGFNDQDNDFYFIESKITALGFKELGQILGYCHVAEPERAYLISTKNLSSSLRTALAIDPSLKNYGNDKSIIFGLLKGDEVEILKV